MKPISGTFAYHDLWDSSLYEIPNPYDARPIGGDEIELGEKNEVLESSSFMFLAVPFIEVTVDFCLRY